MKSDNLKRNDVPPAVIAGASTATSIVITNLSVTGPIRGDVQIVDGGRLIVGADPDSGSRGILSPVALQGYGLNGSNSFSLWFSSLEGHTAGDLHLGNRESAHLRYDQATGTLGLYTANGVGVLFDNDGGFVAGDPNGPHVKWDVASASLKIMAGAVLAAEFMADGSAELGRMTLRDVLMAGDVDGPAIHLGRFVTGGVESAEIIATDAANNPWLRVTAGGSTAYGGYFSLGNQGNYDHRLTFDGEQLVVNGVVIAGPGSMFGDMVVTNTGTAEKADVAQPLLATGAGATADDIITALQTLGLVRQS
jgi:hypothetical protein